MALPSLRRPRRWLAVRALQVATSSDRDADGSTDDDNAGGGGNRVAVWVWVVVGVGSVLVLGALVFLFNWFKNRPLKGDNRTEVAEAERNVQFRKSSQERASAAPTRTHDSNPSVISGLSGASYHSYPAGGGGGGVGAQPLGLTGTEMAVGLQAAEPAFSPISDASKASSEYSQGVDDDGSAAARTPLVPRHGFDYVSSELDSTSTGFSIGDETLRSPAAYPRKKSIEF